MLTGRLRAHLHAGRPGRLGMAALVLAISFGPPCARAQKALAAYKPPASATPPGASIPATIAATASLAGSISDVSGALIPGAHILLTATSTGAIRSSSADAEGRFSFNDLAPGSYALTASAPGFEPAALAHIQLHAGETYQLPTLDLIVPASHADVIVSVTERQLATEELHAEEHQRIVGFPDFYTTYASNPAPLGPGQKFSLALRATTDPMSFVGAALIAGGEQVEHTFPAYGQGVRGYAKRYGAAYTDAFTGKMIGYAVLPTVFRQDPRYYYLGKGSYKHRALHAILSALIARSDSGRMEPNYSHFLGNAAAGALSTLYHPATDSAAKLALDNALLGTLGEAGVNLVREFVLKHVTSGVTPPTSP